MNAVDVSPGSEPVENDDHDSENVVNGVPTTPRKNSASSPRGNTALPSPRQALSPRNTATFGFMLLETNSSVNAYQIRHGAKTET